MRLRSQGFLKFIFFDLRDLPPLAGTFDLDNVSINMVGCINLPIGAHSHVVWGQIVRNDGPVPIKKFFPGRDLEHEHPGHPVCSWGTVHICCDQPVPVHVDLKTKLVLLVARRGLSGPRGQVTVSINDRDSIVTCVPPSPRSRIFVCSPHNQTFRRNVLNTLVVETILELRTRLLSTHHPSWRNSEKKKQVHY